MCKHEWVGHENGVTCELCGMNLTAKQYVNLLAGEEKSSPVQIEEKPIEKPVEKTVKRGRPSTKK